MKLRQYQATAITKLKAAIVAGNERVILCAPTGAGKTVIFSQIALGAFRKGKRVLIVTDRIELLKQSGGALNRLKLSPAEIKAGGKAMSFTAPLYVAMVETLGRRMKKEKYQQLLAGMDVIIFDEAHKQAFNKLMPFIEKGTIVIGATATPFRARSQTALSEFYTAIVDVIQIPELIEKGFLSQPHSYGIPTDLSNIKLLRGDFDANQAGEEFSKQHVYESVIMNYKLHSSGKKALSFSSNIKSSLELTYKMREAGLNARHLDSTMKGDRNDVLRWFENTPNAILNNVGILTTGFDCPTIETIILYRATMSLPLFLQMVGRGSRTTESKSEFIILDFGGNIQRHGFWQAKRIWSLEKAAKRSKKEKAPPVKTCPECDALVALSAKVCNYCEYVFPVKEKETIIEQLQLLTPPQVRAIASQSSIQQKAELAKAKLINPRWVLYNLETFEEKREFCQLMNYKPGYLYRFLNHSKAY